MIHPQVVSLLFGPFEVRDHLIHGHWIHIGMPAFDQLELTQLQRAVSVLSAGGAKVVLFTSPYYDQGERLDGSPWPEDDPSRGEPAQHADPRGRRGSPGHGQDHRLRSVPLTRWPLSVGDPRCDRPHLRRCAPHTGRGGYDGTVRLPPHRPDRSTGTGVRCGADRYRIPHLADAGEGLGDRATTCPPRPVPLGGQATSTRHAALSPKCLLET